MSTLSKKKGMFDWYFKSNLLIRILLGLILGAITGIIIGPSIEVINPMGALFINLLKMIILPVVLSSLIVGAASISPSELGKVGIKILVFYILTSAFAVAVGLLMGNIFKPGMGMALGSAVDAAGKSATAVKLSTTLLNIIPKNIFGSLAAGKMLPVVFFSLIFGVGIAHLKDSNEDRIKKVGNSLFDFFDGVAEVMYLLVRAVLQYAPFGVFALIAVVFAKQGAKAVGPLGMVTLATFSGFLVHVFIVYGGMLLLNKYNPLRFLGKVRTPMVTAFVTRSSSGTLPVTMKAVSENLGVSKKVYSFTLPLGATINMDGTAIYQGVCALFIAFSIGMDLTLGQQLTVIITAVLTSIGAAGTPGTGVIVLLVVLNSIGISVDAGTPAAAAYAMILGIDAILDMGRTTVNVIGDMTGTLIVAKSENEVDESKWTTA